MNKWVYDIETYPNFFSFAIEREDGFNPKLFEISDRKNETEGLMKALRYLASNNQYMVGFNNVGFDYVVIDYIIQKSKKALKQKVPLELTAFELYKVAQEIIESNDRFGKTIWNPDIKQIDLYKIHHFDNVARSTSLKVLEFNMRSENIEDLPYPPGTYLTEDEMEVTATYNRHDVSETRKFLAHTQKAIEFREQLSKTMGIDTTNFNDTKIGKEFFIRQLEKNVPGICYTRKGNRNVPNQTERPVINVGDILFDYYEFHRPEFNAVLNWFKELKIYETKGVLTDIEEHNLGGLVEYAPMKTKRQKFIYGEPSEEKRKEFLDKRPKGWIEAVPLKTGKLSWWKYWRVAEKLAVRVNGLDYVFGTGGLHASVDTYAEDSDEDVVIMDADVSNLAVA